MTSQPPHLRRQGSAQQLIVDDQPFLIIGGELHNSSASSSEYMEPLWQRMKDMRFNTVLAPVYWELVEPEEGRFDFTLVDSLISGARHHGLRLVILWFGSWKNGMSSYAPLWVKRDVDRFPRASIGDGRTVEVLSTLTPANCQADATAFAALMAHIRKIDHADNTVVMMQVENEVGVMGDSRDRSERADAAFSSAVPEALVTHIKEHKDVLSTRLRESWEVMGCPEEGTWEELFGVGPHTDELFMAWHYACYVEKVTAAGRSEYDIPMYTNAWLGEPPTVPGTYPSGGPLPHVMDLWKAAAPSIDFLAPDIYAEEFAHWCEGFVHRGNSLFIPEMRGYGAGPRNVFYAVAQHDAIGVSPFAVDSIRDPSESKLAASYDVLNQLAPLILEHQGKEEMTAVLLDGENPEVIRELGDYELIISLDQVFGYKAELGFGLIIQESADTFIGAGSGFRVKFRPTSPGPSLGGIGTVEEGVFSELKWVPGRRLNGDESDQGRRWRFGSDRIRIERCVVYRYE
jgi:beta-galactosidase GanA